MRADQRPGAGVIAAQIGVMAAGSCAPGSCAGVPLLPGVAWVRHGGGSLLAVWKALEGQGSIRVLAHPTLVARSGEKASFHAGGEFPIPIASSQGTAGGGVTVTIEWKAFGVRVDFTPTVDEDGTINLVVDSEVSQLDFTNALTLSGFVVPSVVVRRTATTVSPPRYRD